MSISDTTVYLDHASTTPVDPVVLELVTSTLRTVYGNPSSFYREGHLARRTLEDARERLASVIGAAAPEFFFTASGSEADNWALKGVAEARQAQGRHLITTKVEHQAVLNSMRQLEKQGYEVTWLDVDRYGAVTAAAVEAALRPDTTLVSVMYANNEIGTVNPIAEIAAVCRERDVLFHSDAVQAFGALPLDVGALGVDLMSFSGHKLYAPKGIGGLYVRRGVRPASLIHGGGQERNRRAGTENVAFAAGFALAAEQAIAQLAAESRRLTGLRDQLIAGLRSIPHTRLNGHPQNRLPNNVNVSFEFIEGESILLLLDQKGYRCSSGSACTSGSLDPSHVLLAIGLPHEVAHGSLRVTLGRENTADQLERFLADLSLIVERLRALSPLYADFEKGRISNLIDAASKDDRLQGEHYGIL